MTHDLDLDRLEEAVKASVSRGRYGDAMDQIKAFVEYVINDPETVGAVFASRELDALCTDIARAYYAGNRGTSGIHGGGTVILASELVRAGGHVELIKDYLAMGVFESPVRVALTDLFNRIEPGDIDSWASLLGCEVYVAREAELDGKLGAVSTWIRDWNPSTIVTLGHNQDVVAIVAAHAPGAEKRYYIHHGDHHLSLGVTCEAFYHVDLHNMAYDLCGNEIGVAGQLYWPISAVRPAEVKAVSLGRGALTTCSCGRMSKFESGTYALRYERAVASILGASGGYHVHIGELSEAFLEKIYVELDIKRISHDRLIHIDWVPSLARALIDNAVDVYVSSFPLGGGKALIEAMSVGVPVVTHESYRSRYHSGCDLTYPESYTWRQYDDLDRIFTQWDEQRLRCQAELALCHFARYYSHEAFLAAFGNGVNSCAADIPPLRAYRPDRLQNYLDNKRRRMIDNGRLESEKNRIFREWKSVKSAYDEHVATIEHLRGGVEILMRENRELSEKILAQERPHCTAFKYWITKIGRLFR